jgi:xanthine dehydrogenase FAD-binding subunit
MVTGYRPENLQEALRIRTETGAIPLAGGTDLMVAGKRTAGLSPRFGKPVVFIGQLGELRTVCMNNGVLHLGPAASFSDLLSNRSIPDIFKTVFSEIASPAVRNRATIGGNICNASPAGDSLPLLYALDASVVLESSRGRRTVSIDRFITGPGATLLREDELVVEIQVPVFEFNLFFYRKIGTRRGYSCSKTSFLGMATAGEKGLEEIRIAIGAVAPTVVRSKDVEEQLNGKTVREIETAIPEAVSLYKKHITPIDDQRSTACYRRDVSVRLIRHFLYYVSAHHGFSD